MINTITLDNNIRIVYEKLDFVRSVSIGIWVNNGSVNESDKESGISHFIEHMLFKGTDKRSAKDIADTMDGIGGHLNAFTSKEYTCYYARTLDSHFDTAIDVLSDMFFCSKYDNEEIKKERKVIVEEINMYDDMPEDLVFENMCNAVYEDSSLGRAILGTKESISKFGHEDFKKFFDEKYTPENIVVSVCGNFDTDYMIDEVKKYFSHHKNNSSNVVTISKPEFKVSRVKCVKDIEQVHMNIAYEGISYFDKNYYSMPIFNSIFGGNMSSILFQQIREKYGYAYSIYSQNLAYKNTGIFSIYAGLSSEYVNHVLEIVQEEIQNLQKVKITNEQIQKAKEQFKSNYFLGLESSNNIMNHMGMSTIVRGKVLTTDEIMNEIDAVSIDTLYEVIDRVFKNDVSISLVGNVEDVDIERL